MILNEPKRSPYDLSFDLFGFPIRVHPGFFILPVIFGSGSLGGVANPGVVILIFILAFFISILVHELGHAFALRFFGVPSRVVLYWMGGLAIHDNGGWGGKQQLSPNQQIIVSLAGPAAGFMLAALVVGIVFALGGTVQFQMDRMFPLLVPGWEGTAIESNASLRTLFFVMLFCNIVWNILNLAPVLPLDGGRVIQEMCIKADYSNGIRYSLMISVGAGGVIAFMGFSMGDRFVGIFFALMAISAYMTLQQMSGRGQGRW
ncbi:MAG: site-2 protease family protein [Pirellulaceae bacterium]|nr:site-2 protease family protein [Pirellulaceae bacterium]